jgi:exopolyphosphatase/guanosine-5'-triphosphate,3'-diphosphate pyrophosphatase
MPVKLSQTIILAIGLYLMACSSHDIKSCLETRAAFDIGSGSTKMKVYKVNSCTNKIISLVEGKSCDYSDKVAYKESLVEQNLLSDHIINKGLKVLNLMKINAKKCGATQFQATATSAFRQASNGQQAVKKLQKSGIHISIISQEEEARLGFVGGASKKPELDSKNLCVWDIGGSSMQIVCSHHGKIKTFLGHLASIPFKEHILKIQSSKKNSPNPISAVDYHKSKLITQSEAKKIFSKINKNHLQTKPVIGIGGVHYYAVSQAINAPTYTVQGLEKAIKTRLNKSNQELGGGKYANTALSNIILVKEMMESMGIPTITAVKVNLTEGLVLSEANW